MDTGNSVVKTWGEGGGGCQVKGSKVKNRTSVILSTIIK